jgi:hypothetical protein
MYRKIKDKSEKGKVRLGSNASFDFSLLSFHSEESGTVLLLALLIMTSVIISSAGLGSLILNSLQQTRAIDNSIIAYYAAETGIEDALYRARRLEVLPPDVADRTLSGPTRWSRTVVTTESVLYAAIPENSLYEVALFDPDNEALGLGIKVVKIAWDLDCDPACPTLSATLVGWQPQNPIIWDPNAIVYKFTGSDAVLSVDPSKLFKLRLRAEHNALNGVRIQAFLDDAQTQPAPLPGRLRITSTGEHVGTRQRVIVSVPRRTPLSSVYDFVIFSDCSIVKGGAGISCPQ